jgi:hypothetical protein
MVARPVWAGEAVAMVTDKKGAATVIENGAPSRLELLAYLMPGSEVELAKDAKLIVTYFSSSKEYAFSGPARILINADAPRITKGLAAEVRNIGQDKAGAAKKFSIMQRQSLAQATFEMRAARAGIRLVGPIETALLGVTPEFTWFGPNEATGYHFSLLDESGGEIQSLDTNKTAWRVHDASPLKRGASYRWKVETTLPSGETLSASGRFTVLDQKRASEIVAAHPRPDAEFSERVLYAAKLETEGLKYDAKAEWQALARERPDDPVLQDMATR